MPLQSWLKEGLSQLRSPPSPPWPPDDFQNDLFLGKLSVYLRFSGDWVAHCMEGAEVKACNCCAASPGTWRVIMLCLCLVLQVLTTSGVQTAARSRVHFGRNQLACTRVDFA